MTAVVQLKKNSVFYYPARARIKQKSGAQKHMSKLNIGALLQSAAASSRGNQIQSRLVNDDFEFRELHARPCVLRATPAHYIYTSGRYIPARDAKVGDVLELADDSQRAVTSARTVMNKELYNLLTVHGGIIVNSVRTATSKDAVLSPLHSTLDHLCLPYTGSRARRTLVQTWCQVVRSWAEGRR